MAMVRMILGDSHLISWVEVCSCAVNWILPASACRYDPYLFCRVSLFLTPFKTIYPYGIFKLALFALEVCTLANYSVICLYIKIGYLKCLIEGCDWSGSQSG